MISLDSRVVSLILDQLELKDVVRCASLNRLWRDVALDDSRWQRYCDSDLDEQEKKDSLWSNQPMPTWYRTYTAYMDKFSGLNLGHADCCVAVRFWQAIRKWAEVHFPFLLQTLNPGLKPDVIQDVLSHATHPIPDVLIAVYAIADGQTLPRSGHELVAAMDEPVDTAADLPASARRAMFAGVFGKNSTHRTHNIMADFARAASGLFRDTRIRDAVQQRAYGDVLLTRLQRSPEGDLFTTYAPNLLRRHGPEEGLRAGYFTLSRSNMWPKSVVVDVLASDRPGGPQVLRHNPVEVSSYSSASPTHYPQVLDLVTEKGKARAMRQYAATGAPELCAWLEGYATMVKSGQAVVKEAVVGMLEEPVPFLELVPKMEAAAECVTQGIRVRAIAWVTPHAEYNGNLLFSYRVHFSHVIQPGEAVPGGMVRKAQLKLRHWEIFAPGASVPCQEVQGDGVVGDYPVIEPGATYEYGSMCPGQYGGGMEGWFLFFVSGRTPAEPTVKVRCPRIDFTEPDFLF